jgi:hydroxymethylpyrimidine pyrophosphatase-like HAD family hydrolase
MATIRLISTDFDGTLIGFDSDGRCTADFANVLGRHVRAGGLWALNTGRGVEHALEGLARFKAPVLPDFLLTHERHVFKRNAAGGWIEHGDWNRTCQKRHEDLYGLSGELFKTIHAMAEKSSGITLLYEKDWLAGLVASSEEIMEEVVREIERAAVAVPDFGFQRNSIYLRFCHRDYHKGSALGELSRLEGIALREVFAVGDHFNDLSMLDGSYAAMVACPDNAIEPVKEMIRRAGGYVAAKKWADGVAEALEHYSAHQWH